MKQMIEHYFAIDGNYGDASLIVIVDTTDWDKLDWIEIEEASDWERHLVAQEIANRKVAEDEDDEL